MIKVSKYKVTFCPCTNQSFCLTPSVDNAADNRPFAFGNIRWHFCMRKSHSARWIILPGKRIKSMLFLSHVFYCTLFRPPQALWSARFLTLWFNDWFTILGCCWSQSLLSILGMLQRLFDPYDLPRQSSIWWCSRMVQPSRSSLLWRKRLWWQKLQTWFWMPTHWLRLPTWWWFWRSRALFDLLQV